MDSSISLLNIVLIEDNDNIRLLTGTVLRSLGHNVIEVSCAEDVENMVGGKKVDVFVIDIGLPGENGFSLIQRLRSVDPHVGILIVSAKSGLEDKISGYSMGADIYLNKPLEMAELSAAIHGLSKRVAAHRRSVTGARDGMTLNVVTMQLSGSQGQVALTASEVKLLAAMVRAPNHKMNFGQICTALDADPTDQFKAALEVRIVRLRKKLLSVGAGVTCIKSTRQSGYQLCAHLLLC